MGDFNDQVPEPTRPTELVLVQQTDKALATEIDRQVATAKTYPRQLALVLKQARDMACVNPEVAGSCYYHLKRKDKNQPDGFKHIYGPSVRMAEIFLSSWGNIRTQATIIEEGERRVIIRGTSWDMEKNVLASVDVVRSIWGHYGRYSDDMIAVTIQAGISLGLRNSVFRVVPRVYIDELVETCQKVAGGDKNSLSANWSKAVAAFGAMSVSPEQMLVWIGIKGIEDLRSDHIKDLRGLHTSIRDGETTVEEAFAFASEPKAPKDQAQGIKDALRAKQAPPAQPLAPEASAEEMPEVDDRVPALVAEAVRKGQSMGTLGGFLRSIKLDRTDKGTWTPDRVAELAAHVAGLQDLPAVEPGDQDQLDIEARAKKIHVEDKTDKNRKIGPRGAGVLVSKIHASGVLSDSSTPLGYVQGALEPAEVGNISDLTIEQRDIVLAALESAPKG